MSTYIKICGIETPEMAFDVVQLGADYIGVVFAEISKRAVSLSAAKEIGLSVQQADAKLVGIFSEQTAAEIIEIAHEAKLDYVQLHGDAARMAYANLPSDIATIYATPYREIASAPLLNAAHDVLLVDAMLPGGGEVFEWHNFTPPTVPWFLAGGLNASNVGEAISLLKPYGVDVSSGVENTDGKKDLLMIKDFVHAVRQKDSKR